MKRKGIPPSMKWRVFARDGFRCRYCGIPAGEAGAVLSVDHAVSVADGGPDGFDNLISACQQCNGGKGSRSATPQPCSADALAMAESQAAALHRQAVAIAAVVESRKQARQAIINMVAAAYNKPSFNLSEKHIGQLLNLSERVGPDVLLDWICQTAHRGIGTSQMTIYVQGIARRVREQEAAAP